MLEPTRYPILIDTNIPVYAAGRPHPLKAPSVLVLDLAARNRSAFFINAEVLQELFHRYTSPRVWDTFQAPFYEFAYLMSGRVEPVLEEDVLRAAALMEKYDRLSARDLIHVAVTQRVGSGRIVTTDGAFDEVEGIVRLDPARIAEWEASVTA